MAFYSDPPQSYDPFYDRADWYSKFAWLPHTCDKSGEKIWLEHAYRGVRMITGPGDPVFEYRWIKRHEWLIQRLKGNI